MGREDSEAIYDAIEKSGMAWWIGGGGPANAHENFATITAHIDLPPAARVLDFGCGVGRTAVPLAEHLSEGELVGIDIVPAMIAFCRREFAGRYPRAQFYCSAARHDHYDRFVAEAETPRLTEEEIARRFTGHFDLAVAFSVFTHFDPAMARRYLRLLRGVLRPGGRLLATWFFDHPDNPWDARLHAGEAFHIRWPAEPFAWVTHSLPAVFGYGRETDLNLERIALGRWRDDDVPGLKGQNGQDVAIFRAGIAVFSVRRPS